MFVRTERETVGKVGKEEEMDRPIRLVTAAAVLTTRIAALFASQPERCANGRRVQGWPEELSRTCRVR